MGSSDSDIVPNKNTCKFCVQGLATFLAGSEYKVLEKVEYEYHKIAFKDGVRFKRHDAGVILYDVYGIHSPNTLARMNDSRFSFQELAQFSRGQFKDRVGRELNG